MQTTLAQQEYGLFKAKVGLGPCPRHHCSDDSRNIVGYHEKKIAIGSTVTISICINADSRPGVDAESTQFTGHNQGCRNFDFLTEGLKNKRLFFRGFNLEIISYLDETVHVPDETVRAMRELSDCVVIRKHFTAYRGIDPCGYANDIRYLHALSQATGEIVVHFDADTVAFARDKSAVEGWLSHLDQFAFVSYLSQWSPRPVEDASFGRHTWASTRAFACKRDTLKFDELEHALRDPEWAYGVYGQPQRKLPWTEHFLSLMNEESVFYPPRQDERMMIFCWSRYVKGTLGRLNAMPYGDVLKYVRECGGISYPCDVFAR